jgi:hypothetical protein
VNLKDKWGTKAHEIRVMYLSVACQLASSTALDDWAMLFLEEKSCSKSLLATNLSHCKSSCFSEAAILQLIGPD